MFKFNKKNNEELHIDQVLNESAHDAQLYKSNGALSEDVRVAINNVANKYIDEISNRVDAELKAALAPTFKEDINQVKDILRAIHECKAELKQCDTDIQVDGLTPNDLKLIKIKRAKIEDQKVDLEIQLLEAMARAEGTSLIAEPVNKIAEASDTAFDSTLSNIDKTICTLHVQLIALRELRTRVYEAKGTLINKCLSNHIDLPISELALYKALAANKPLVKTMFKL